MFNHTVQKWFALCIAVPLVWAIWALSEIDIWAAVFIGGLLMISSKDFLLTGNKPLFIALMVSPVIGILLHYLLLADL